MHDDAPSEKPDPSLCGATGPRVPIIAPIAPKRVVFVLYDGFQPLDLAGPWQAFSSANEEAEAALYQLGTVAAEPVVATWDQGLRMQVDCTFSEDGDGPVDMIVVPGGPGVERASAHGETRAWLRRRDAGTRRTCSVCTGAFLLASAGLLDGRVVTTHWRSADRLRQLYPALRVEDDRLYVDSGKYWTSAGVSAGIDLALALIERDHGPELSQQVARRLVVFMRRGGDQRQYSQTLRLQDRAGAPFRELVQKMEARLSARWSIDDMADACGMSRRTFQRKFIAHFGVAPTEVLRMLRRERAGAVQASGKMSKKEMERHLGPLG
jgi:transcriptional regulator GlxA family with amidase domain